MNIFENGIQGLSDTKWSGAKGSAYRLVGVDYRSEPGVIKAHQKLSKISATTVDELCKVGLPLSDGSTLWFSNESGKIWREVSDTFSLLGTLTIPGYKFNLRTAQSVTTYTYNTQVNIPQAHFFSTDGTKMYVLCNATVSGNNGEIFQYTLSTAYDVSTASYASKTFVADANSRGMFISSDGLKMYVCEDNGTYSVIEYDLGTAWDISTASASGDTYDFSAQTNRGYGIWFKSDGTEMYIVGGDDDSIHQYTLSTGFDLTTVSYTGSLDLTSDGVSLFYGIAFSSDGKRMLVMDDTSAGRVAQYLLTTAYDITTATFDYFYDTDSNRYYGLGILSDESGFVVGIQDSSQKVYQYSMESASVDTSVTVLSAEEYSVDDGVDDASVQYVYFATENWLLRIGLSDIANIFDPDHFEYLTMFTNSDDTYHPMKIANNRLFIGDKYCITQVEESGVITLETNLTVRAPERITILANFDVDLLVGTKRLDEKSRILRWDTESETWYGEDTIYEGEIHAFLDEDNYTYAIVGDFGQMEYYDGEKLLKRRRIPGDYSSSAKCKVNPNAVGYFMGIPVFGISNISGNPTLQGVYSYGQYDVDYPITLDLSYPISSGEFSGLEIGAIVIQGTDMYVSWKSGTTVGVDKLDWTTKYNGAYIETMVLNNAKDRSRFKSLDAVLADYIEMPTSTSLTIKYSKNYASYVTLAQVNDAKLLQLRAKATVPEIGAIQTKFIFNTNSNDSPRIENFHTNFKGEV